jgi:hypothetical protein
MVNFFEQPWTLLVVAIIVLFFMLIWRRVAPGKQRWWQLALPFLIAAAGFSLDVLVATDAEKIRTVIEAAVKAVEEENPDAIEPLISTGYRDSYHNSKSSLMQHGKRRLSKPLIEENIARIIELNLHPPNAKIILTVRVVFDKRSDLYQSFTNQMFTKLEVNLQKGRDGDWLISRAEILEINRQPAKWDYIR